MSSGSAGTHGAPTYIQMLIAARPIGVYQIGLIITCALVLVLDGYDLHMMSVAVPEIARQWNVPPATFGLVLSATMIGLAVGAAAIAPLGDRIGRRPLTIVSIVLMGGATMLTPLCGSHAELFATRFAVGVCIGVCIPNVTALLADWIPSRRKAFVLTLLACSASAGSFLCGYTAPPVLAGFGWQGMFLGAGVVMLAYGALLYWILPESLEFMAARHPQSAEFRRLLSKVSDAATEVPPAAPARTPARSKVSVMALLSPPYRTSTLLWWGMFTMNAFTFYALSQWLPTLLHEAGFSSKDAQQSASMIYIGGITGSLLVSWLVDRVRRKTVPIVTAYAIAITALLAFHVVPHSASWWAPLLFTVGLGVLGVHFLINPIGSLIYPPSILATALGFGATVTRIGAVLAPIVGGIGLAAGMTALNLFGGLIVSVSIAAVLAILLFRRSGSGASGSGSAQTARAPLVSDSP